MIVRDTGAGDVRGDLKAVLKELSNLSSRIQAIERRTEQLATLRAEDGDVEARIAQLERVLDFERVDLHARDAVSKAQLLDGPVPRLEASGLLPLDVFQALVEAIPARVFLDGRVAHEQELRVPPRLAPTYSIVTWGFLTEVVLKVLSQALMTRFEDSLGVYLRARFPSLPPLSQSGMEITLSEGRITRRTSGWVGHSAAERPWDLLTGVLHLKSEAVDGSLQTKPSPFQPNGLLAFLGPQGAHSFAAIPDSALGETEFYSYEFGIGPTREARRALTSMMGASEPVQGSPLVSR